LAVLPAVLDLCYSQLFRLKLELAKRPWINNMLKFFLYVLAGILAVALGVLVFLHQCVHLPQWAPKPTPTEHSAGHGSSFR
jgi:hypothetical protein